MIAEILQYQRDEQQTVQILGMATTAVVCWGARGRRMLHKCVLSGWRMSATGSGVRRRVS